MDEYLIFTFYWAYDYFLHAAKLIQLSKKGSQGTQAGSASAAIVLTQIS